jgi:phenylalanyl-tRNA synthetase beta chain
VAEAFDVVPPAVVVDVDLSELHAVGAAATRFAPLPRFPASTRDLAVVVVDRVSAGDVRQAARDAAADLAERVLLFDLFEGGNVPTGHKNLGLRVIYRAPDRTLTDAEIDARHATVVAAVQARFGATLRS